MANNVPFIQKLVVVGVGLIGGSLALALRRAGAVRKIIGVGRSQTNLKKAIEAGVVDAVAAQIDEAARDADMIVLATPVNTISHCLNQLSSDLASKVVITDVGSVKADIMHAAKKSLAGGYMNFVPGHPVAGREQSGIDAVRADLFDNHKVVLTPDHETDAKAISLVSSMWEATGASIIFMDQQEHDAVLSLTSHLPHILSYAMMNYLISAENTERHYEMAAGGFYDFTRTASSDPEMWRDISLMNRRRLLHDIQKFQNQLEEIASMIRGGEEQQLQQLFEDARLARSLIADRRNLTR